MKLSRADIRELAAALADELQARGWSGPGIGAPVERTDRCDEKEGSESMDRTSTEGSGESSSPEQIAARLLNRSRQRQRRNVLPMPLAPNVRPSFRSIATRCL